MPELNYHTAEEFIRTIQEVPGVEVIETHGLFRIARVPAPYFQGSEWWVVNEKGFFWEPVEDLGAARAYLETEEAKGYRGIEDSRR